MKRNQLSIVVAVVFLVFSALGVVLGDTANSVRTTVARSLCTVVESYVVVHVVDDKGKPIQNAMVLLNATFIWYADGNFSWCVDNQSGTTDSNGDAKFGVVPFKKYNVTVILPENLPSRSIVVTQIKAPDPTFRTTVNLACTLSVSGRTAATLISEIQTTSTTGSAVILSGAAGQLAMFLMILMVVFVIVIVYVVTRKRERARLGRLPEGS